MTSTARKHQDLPSNLQNLSINTKPQLTHRTSKPSHFSPPIADSWDEMSSSSSSPTTPTTSHSTAPPPTPISAVSNTSPSATWDNPYVSSSSSFPSTDSTKGNIKEQKRPEKSAATAGRLIAGALGVKAPRMSEEQKRYERVVREKERERLGREREEKRREESERERRRREVWEGKG